MENKEVSPEAKDIEQLPPVGKFVDPLTDYGFKLLFGKMKHKTILISLLNAFLAGERVITDLTYGPLDHSGDTGEQRKVIVDLLCITDQGEEIIIELQRAKQDFFRERCVYYTSRLINEQLPRGRSSDDYVLKPVYLIAFLEFTFSDEYEKKNDGRYVRTFCLTDMETGDLFYDKLYYKFIELPKFVKQLDELETNVDKWLYTLKHMVNLEEKPDFEDSVFDWVYKISEVSKLRKEERDMYNSSRLAKADWKHAMDYATNIGIEKGRFDEKIENAREMKKEGIPLAKIIKITKLSAEEVKKL